MPDTGMLAARRRPTVTTEVHARLRRRIVEGKLLPGQRLSENEVAANLGLSRTPVREAFIKLEEEGLLAIYPQYGTFVAPIRVSDVHDSQFVREALECAALTKLATIRTGDDIQELTTMLRSQRKHLAGDPKPFFADDEGFHAALMRMAGHGRAWRVVEAAKGQHDRVRCLSVRDPLKREAIYREHSMVADRLTAGDGQGAVLAMRHHLRGVFVSVEAVMQHHPEFFEASEPAAAGEPGA